MTTDIAKSPYGFGTKFFYGVGSVAFGVKDNGFGALLLLFYNQALGLDARLAGLAIAIALVVDAFLDPLIGYASDHLHTRWGRRHPLMYAAAIPAALSYFFLFSPPDGLSQTGLFAYLLVTAIFVRVFIALFEIPNSALVAEFTQNYDERTSYLNWRLFFGWTAGLTMTVAAFGIFLSVGVGKIPGTQVPANYQAYGIAAAIIMFAAIMASALGTHRTIPWLNRPAVAEGHDKPSSPLQDIRRALSSRSAVMMLLTAGLVVFTLTVLNRLLGLHIISTVAEKTVFALVPPLALIFLVLGSIFIGLATPTEGGAMGATGALVLALLKRRLSFSLLRQAMGVTARLTAFVLFIVIGARLFSLSFYGVNGHLWVEHLFSWLPGGQLGFLIVVNILIFLLAFFLDFFELAFIVVPLLAPVADKLGIDLIWLGILLSVNMQTSFMHPPFGAALFFLRSVAPKEAYADAVTGKRMPPVTWGDIYIGSIPCVVIQLVMVALIIIFPTIVSMGLTKEPVTDATQVEKSLRELDNRPAPDTNQVDPLKGMSDDATPASEALEDPLKGLSADKPAELEDPPKGLSKK